MIGVFRSRARSIARTLEYSVGVVLDSVGVVAQTTSNNDYFGLNPGLWAALQQTPSMSWRRSLGRGASAERRFFTFTHDTHRPARTGSPPASTLYLLPAAGVGPRPRFWLDGLPVAPCQGARHAGARRMVFGWITLGGSTKPPPPAKSRRRARAVSFDHLVGAGEERWRDREVGFASVKRSSWLD